MNSSKSKYSKRKKSKNVHGTSESSGTGGSAQALKSSLLGTIFGVVSALLLLLICSFICYRADDHTPLLIPCALAITYVSALICGFCAGKKNKRGALICGGVSGMMLTAVFLICSLIFKNSAAVSFEFPLSLILRALTVIFSIMGAYIGTAKKSGRKKRR